MKRLVILGLLILSLVISACSDDEVILGADASPDNMPDLIGTYVVNGIDHLGNEYGGHLTVTAGENADEYHFQWIIVEGIQEGQGTVEGNQIQIEWVSLDTSTDIYRGTVAYTVTEDGELYGIRKVDGRVGEGQEIAYPNQ